MRVLASHNFPAHCVIRHLIIVIVPLYCFYNEWALFQNDLSLLICGSYLYVKDVSPLWYKLLIFLTFISFINPSFLDEKIPLDRHIILRPFPAPKLHIKKLVFLPCDLFFIFKSLNLEFILVLRESGIQLNFVSGWLPIRSSHLLNNNPFLSVDLTCIRFLLPCNNIMTNSVS